jgi:ATP adenylyltransferase
MDYIWSPWRYQFLTEAKRDEGCVFCRMGADDPSRDELNLIAFRARSNFVVLNLYPYTSGHMMIVPYEHVAELSSAQEETAAEMMRLTRTAERVLRGDYRPDGINLGMNLGAAAGAGIAGHIHMHVLPRWIGDANFMSTVGETRNLPEELHVTWRKLRDAFQEIGFSFK